MSMPRGPLSYPLGQSIDLLFCKCVCGIDGRHSERFILGGNAADQLALLGMATNDSAAAFTQIGECVGLGIKPQLALVVRCVRAMTGETFVRKNRSDVAAEVYSA